MTQQRIGRYRILEEIAAGGQGAVYRAFDPESGQIVAVKVLHASLTGNRAYLERFRREASLASSIDHPNVVKIFEVGEDSGKHFMALEFLPESLARVIESAGALSVERTAAFGIEIAAGLTAAHALGIVHRDVKPQNVVKQSGDGELVYGGCCFTSPSHLIPMSREDLQSRGLAVGEWEDGIYQLDVYATARAEAGSSDAQSADHAEDLLITIEGGKVVSTEKVQ